MNPISAGSGPAALVLVGAWLLSTGNAAGWLLIMGGGGLSLAWLARFS